MTSRMKGLLFVSDDIAAIVLTVAILWILTSSGIISAGMAFFIGALATTFFAFAAYKTYNLQSMKPKVGTETMIGKKGKTVCELDPEGVIEIEGECWKAISDKPVKKGVSVEIMKVDGLKVTVAQVKPEQLDG